MNSASEKMSDYIQSLIELVRIESVCERKEDDAEYPYGEGVRHALDYALNLCERFGFRTKNCDRRIGYAEIGEGEPLTGILVHLDVVPIGDGWTTKQGEIKDDKLFGRGVIDDKGPAVACIYAMKDLVESGEPINGRIRIIFGQAEETGIWTDMDYYLDNEEHPVQGFTPDAFFPLIYAEKGIIMLTLRAKLPDYVYSISGGNAVNMVPDSCKATIRCPNDDTEEIKTIGKSAHASMPDEGMNAISLLMQTLYSHNERKERDFISFYHDCIGMATDGVDLIGAESDETSGKATLNVGLISTDNGTIELKLDLRYPVSASYENILKRIEEAAKKYEIEYELDLHKEPVNISLDNPFTQTLMDAYCCITGDEPKPISIGGGSYARAMKNIVAFGPLLPGREIVEHEADEYAYLEDLHLIRKIYGKVLQNI